MRLEKVNCSRFRATWKAPLALEQRSYPFIIVHKNKRSQELEVDGLELLSREKDLPEKLSLLIFYSNCSKLLSPEYELADIYTSELIHRVFFSYRQPPECQISPFHIQFR